MCVWGVERFSHATLETRDMSAPRGRVRGGGGGVKDLYFGEDVHSVGCMRNIGPSSSIKLTHFPPERVGTEPTYPTGPTHFISSPSPESALRRACPFVHPPAKHRPYGCVRISHSFLPSIVNSVRKEGIS